MYLTPWVRETWKNIFFSRNPSKSFPGMSCMQRYQYNRIGLIRSDLKMLPKSPLSWKKISKLRARSDRGCSEIISIENWMKPSRIFYKKSTPNLFMYCLLWHLLQLHIYPRFCIHRFSSCKYAISNTFSWNAHPARSRCRFSFSLIQKNYIIIFMYQLFAATKCSRRSKWSWSDDAYHVDTPLVS